MSLCHLLRYPIGETLDIPTWQTFPLELRRKINQRITGLIGTDGVIKDTVDLTKLVKDILLELEDDEWA